MLVYVAGGIAVMLIVGMVALLDAMARSDGWRKRHPPDQGDE